MTKFEGVSPALGQALEKRGYEVLTPVQDAVLDVKFTDADLLVSAQTGSGKTVAFGISLAPTLLEGAERFERASAPLALVVAPTRELAIQVKRELEWLYALTGASIASCVGGMDMRNERRTLERGAHIVVGTPGRLRDHIERRSLDTSAFKAVVLDEADEMLDLGFRDDLEFILESAPSDRRTLMFSATVPRTIASMAKRYQRDAVRVTTASEREQHIDIDYRAITVSPNESENAIVNVLRYFESKSALIFCATRATVNRMTSRFNNRGFSVVALSGELSQNERTHALQAMRDGRARVCIATDVAARGLDLPNLDLVIHGDIPRNSETLLHRSGRTGRAGRKGVCALIVPYNLRSRTDRLLRGANVKAKWENAPSAEDILRQDDERLLSDEMLTQPVSEEEKAFVGTLLERHSAEQIAAAFTRLHRAGRSAPEELLNNAPPQRRDPSQKREPRPRRDRDAGFKDSVWFSLSVGRKHTAEARWILPMLCRAGDLTKQDIGAIKIQETESHVELARGSVEKFLKAIAPNGVVEKNISAKRMDKAPSEAKLAGEPAKRPESRPVPHRQDRGARNAYKGRSERNDRSDRKDRSDHKDSNERTETRRKPAQDNKPYKSNAYKGKSAAVTPKPRSEHTKSPESKPVETKPAENKPTENKPAENKPSENKAAVAKSSNGKSEHRKPRSEKSTKDKKGWAKPSAKSKNKNKKFRKPLKNAKPDAPNRGKVKSGCEPLKRRKLHLN
jgi:ATP-dependent RNA helicase DeaD